MKGKNSKERKAIREEETEIVAKKIRETLWSWKELLIEQEECHKIKA